MKLLITGGAGFIGSAVVRRAIGLGHQVVNVDVLTYAANLDNVAAVSGEAGYAFEQADICDGEAMVAILDRHRPDAVVHVAAETHNDRAIENPLLFVQSNIVGTSGLLEAARAYWSGLAGERRARFRFVHVSTDEVFGALGEEGAFDEASPYDPSSPYSASKAAADHLVRAWGRTFGLPVTITNCANNYGPFQFPEKLIPTVVSRALEGRSIPVYGQGQQVRDWLHVDDHADAILTVLNKGRLGETYLIGGEGTRRNIDLVKTLCALLDRISPSNHPYADNITFVEDRPGHDWRYAIDASKIRRELGWAPKVELEAGLEGVVRWYVENQDWWRSLRERGHASERLGLIRS